MGLEIDVRIAVADVVHRYARDKTGVDLPRLVWSWHPEAPDDAAVLRGLGMGAPETVAQDLRVWAQALSLEPRPHRDPRIEGFPRITEYAGELASVRIRISGITSIDGDG